MNEYLSLTDLGRLYGVAAMSSGAGSKDSDCEPRTAGPAPSVRPGYVSQRPSRHPGTYFWIWHGEKTTAILDGMRYPRAES